MQDFVCTVCRWSVEEWRKVWALRNAVFHGAQDLSSEQQQDIARYLPKLEEAIINALRYLLKIGKDKPPLATRPRNRFYGAKLHLEWMPP